MPQSPIEDLLRRLGSPDDQEAWNEFLTDYSAQIYQSITYLESDPEHAGDCFQFVCEQLIKNNSRRVRKFKGDGAATFSTWLRAVVRNLCIDWHRRRFGRQRPFRSVSSLSLFDQLVFGMIYERRLSPDECLAQLATDFPNTTESQVVLSRARIEAALTPNQRWLLTQRLAQRTGEGAESFDESNLTVARLEDPRPDPEAQAIQNQRQDRLRRAMSKLEPNERLLIRLRFEEGLTLDQVAKMLGLGNAQRVDREINESLSKLRKLI
jgi:RNA polymerase sigma factor (sigma-70 family)